MGPRLVREAQIAGCACAVQPWGPRELVLIRPTMHGVGAPLLPAR